MDCYPGTLRQYIRPDHQLSTIDWMRIMLGISERLVFAHERGFPHGDLKPSNGFGSDQGS